MLNCLCKTTTMNFEDFFKFKRGQLTIEEIMKNNNINDFVNKVMKNDKVRRFTIVLLASIMYAGNAFAAGKGIDSLGNIFLNLIRQWAYWIVLIMCLVDVVRAGVGGDSKKILSIICKYLIVFASLYLVPSLFDAVKNSGI